MKDCLIKGSISFTVQSYWTALSGTKISKIRNFPSIPAHVPATITLEGTIGTADKAVVMWEDYLELKEKEITIADTEAGAIAYICKKNDIECIIKGISDFPTDERSSDKFESNMEQINAYLENTPKVMNKIFGKYLKKFI